MNRESSPGPLCGVALPSIPADSAGSSGFCSGWKLIAPFPGGQVRVKVSPFDVAVGVQQDKLTAAVEKLYGKLYPITDGNIFKGTRNFQGTKVEWDVRKPPGFQLEAPTLETWKTCIDRKGNSLSGATSVPSGAVFSVILPEFFGQFTREGGDPIGGATKVIAYGKAEVAAKALTIKTLALWLDQSHWNQWDKTIVNQVIVPQVLDMVDSVLAGLKLPVLEPVPEIKLDLELGEVLIADKRLLITAVQKSGRGDSRIDLTIPQKDVFALLGKDLAGRLISGKIQKMSAKERQLWDWREDYKYLKPRATVWLDKVLDISFPGTSDPARIKARPVITAVASVDPGSMSEKKCSVERGGNKL
ncbi:hypothetical protein LZ318_21130 [Saccharopolyspora indica]|uniref:hypothetical protein n=1 Tax=Saccharopolyspora indica TaxID=1229659 RepID=UPI0022EB626A|nr:hypothetical protein [Saccharopolyspora indica]MDA3642452.1 hypothetical protein [Saccharopolyspora indica]